MAHQYFPPLRLQKIYSALWHTNLQASLFQEASPYSSSVYCYSCLPLHPCTYRGSSHQFFFCSGLKEGFVPKLLNGAVRYGGILPSIICYCLRVYFSCIVFFCVFFLMPLNDLEWEASSEQPVINYRCLDREHNAGERFANRISVHIIFMISFIFFLPL